MNCRCYHWLELCDILDFKIDALKLLLCRSEFEKYHMGGNHYVVDNNFIIELINVFELKTQKANGKNYKKYMSCIDKLKGLLNEN